MKREKTNIRNLYSYHSGSIEYRAFLSNFFFSLSFLAKHTPSIKILCSMNEFNLNWCYRLRYMHYMVLFFSSFYLLQSKLDSSLTLIAIIKCTIESIRVTQFKWKGIFFISSFLPCALNANPNPYTYIRNFEIPSNISKSHVIRFRKFSDGQHCIKHKSNFSLN